MRFLARDTVFYGVAGVTNKAFLLVTLPLLTRHFGLQVYGSVDFLYVAILFLSAIVIVGQDSSVARYFWDDEDPSRRRQVVTQSLAIQLAAAVAVAAALLPLVDRLPLPISAFDDEAIALRLVVLHLPFMVLFNFAQGMLKWTFARRSFAIITLGQTAMNATLLVVVVFWLDGNVVDVFAVSLMSRAVFAVVGILLCRRWLARPRAPSYLKPLLAFGVPFAIIGTIGTFVPVLERSTVGALMGPADLGLYAAGATIALIISLPIQAFQTAWGPFALAIHREEDARTSYNQVLKGFTLLCGVAVVSLVALAPLALTVLSGSEFSGGAVVVLPLALGLAIQGISWISEIGITLSKRAHLQIPAYAAFLVIGGASLALLAEPLGLMGVAAGIFLGHVAKALVATTLAQRAYPLAWSYAPIVLMVAATALLAATVSAVGVSGGHIAAVIAGLVGSGVLVLFAWTTVFESGERARLLQAVASAWRPGDRGVV